MGILTMRNIRSLVAISFLLICCSVNQAIADSHGVIGEKITDFSATITSITYLEDRNVLNIQSDGEVGPYGTVGVTATFMHSVDAKRTTGAYSSRGISFRPDGTLVGITGQGAWRSLGKHRWEVKTIGISTEGKRSLAVGVVELATMSFKGSIYALD
jgi:hypothetical protein